MVDHLNALTKKKDALEGEKHAILRLKQDTLKDKMKIGNMLQTNITSFDVSYNKVNDQIKQNHTAYSNAIKAINELMDNAKCVTQQEYKDYLIQNTAKYHEYLQQCATKVQYLDQQQQLIAQQHKEYNEPLQKLIAPLVAEVQAGKIKELQALDATRSKQKITQQKQKKTKKSDSDDQDNTIEQQKHAQIAEQKRLADIKVDELLKLEQAKILTENQAEYQAFLNRKQLLEEKSKFKDQGVDLVQDNKEQAHKGSEDHKSTQSLTSFDEDTKAFWDSPFMHYGNEILQAFYDQYINVDKMFTGDHQYHDQQH